MKNRFSFAIAVLLIGTTAASQEISRQEADSMRHALEKAGKTTDRIGLLLHLAQFHIFKAGESEIDFDSAKIYIAKAKTLNKTLRSRAADGYILLTESYIIKEKGDRERGKKMTEEAVSVLKADNNISWLGPALYELSTYYDYQDSVGYRKKMELVNKSISAFGKARDYKGKGRALEMLGDLQMIGREDDNAISSLTRALAAYDSAKYPKLQGAYVLLSGVYIHKRNYSQALFYLLKSLKTAQALKDTSSQMAQINNSLATLYYAVERYEIAVRYTQEALKMSRKYNDESSVFYLSMNLSNTYGFLGKFDSALYILSTIPNKFLVEGSAYDRHLLASSYIRAFIDLKQYGNAQPYCDTLLRILRDENLPDNNRSSAYRVIANHYFGLSRFAESRYYIEKSLDIADKVNYATGRILSTRILYKLDSAEQNYPAAFRNLAFYKAKADSVSNEKRGRQFDILRVEYEVEMKEDSIKMRDKDIAFLTQTNSLQQANLNRQNLIKNITIAAIIAALVFIILLYRQYKQKEKNNKLITHKNDQLQHLLTEKEWLLKEIHHRVKNNLQIVMSLLNSQSAYIDNEPALTAIHDSQHRVQAMSLIHQKLYNTENVSTIDIALYIRELALYLNDSFNTENRVRFEFGITPLEMDVSQAVPLGLILNEAITNSLKYAFPDNRNGVITISLSPAEPGRYLLEISDNGIGLVQHFDNRKPGSLGMSLMKGLSDDIDGNFSIESRNGTTIKVSFNGDAGTGKAGTFVSPYITSN